jgi:hypothetical protein
VLNGEATNINFIVFGFDLIRARTHDYHTRDEEANRYTNDELKTEYVLAIFLDLI